MTPNDKLKAQQKKNGLAGFKVDLWNYEGEKGALIPLLQAAQDTYGYIPESAPSTRSAKSWASRPPRSTA